MAINPIQTNIDNTKSHKPYREASGRMKTDKNIKPLAPEGHLVHDRVLQMPKYFLKDLAYDAKAVRDGLRGTANDHQTGRLNDVGLKIGGIGIATLLAARTKDPIKRIMEYAGLGAFLFAMSVFPKAAIQAPSRALHGFDSGIEYIDDQGRKKSVFQDSNYIPFDMYQGEYPSEDLDIIGDRMGIPRDIKNRHDIIKEQMRKIATQNNTLWMLTAGFATPVIAALTCCGLEKLISPVVEYARNARYNSSISHALNLTSNMKTAASEIDSNKLSKKVEKLLSSYKDKELPKAEFDNLVKMLTENVDANTSEGIVKDLKNIFNLEKKGAVSFIIDEGSGESIINSIKNNLPANNRASLERVFVPSKEEISEILKKSGSGELTEDQLQNLKGELKKFFGEKIAKETTLSKEYLNGYQNQVIERISKSIQQNKSNFVSEGNIKEVVDFAKIMGEFKHNDKVLDKCKSFKVEHAPETVLARSYAKFEKTLFKELGITFKDMKQLKDLNGDKVAEILQSKLEALAKDEAKFEKAISKLKKVMSDMEVKLNGKSNDGAHLKDLITAIENNYNNTAKRLNEAGKGKFKNTIDRLVKEDVSTLSNSIKSRQELFDILDGNKPNKFARFNYWGGDDAARINYAKENAKGVGSSKNATISRIVERYQGQVDSFNRMLHTMDVYKRPIPEGEYDKAILNISKEALLTADSKKHTLKFDLHNNPDFYKDIMNTTWRAEDAAQAGSTHGKGYISESTKKAMGESKDLSTGNIRERFQQYINRFRNIIGNNEVDFTKPEHLPSKGAGDAYSKEATTRMAKFNLVGQRPVDFVQGAAKRRYSNQKWMRIVSVIGGVVLGGTVLAQLAFGKIKNPHNIQKQVSDDTNN